jgi:Co/Zn/Cd efflux system component
MEAKNAAERKTLKALLAINGSMFVIGCVTGLLAHSTALIADSLDMFADASVYLLSLYAVGKAARYKNRAAFFSGSLQISLAAMTLVNVVQRFIAGDLPESHWMMGISLLALVANSFGLYLLAKHRHGEVHMQASWIFTQNDVIANLSVIIAGILVSWLRSPMPDLIAGFGISILVIWGGITIIKTTRADSIL